ncbi:putative uncharacterized protein DDB_G0286901, partial [Sitodiplosis mosellana]|uniref:putative uncharacterized protein DDB_G0286901 n=1 Tax=Sitodiplosis mosellana TaxID=263140 RepID=UPI0024448CE3
MAEDEIFKYLGQVSKIITTTYKGDPNGRDAFITSIELANTITKSDFKQHLIQFIKTKLEGRALETLPENVGTVEEIIQAIKGKIKPESSKVVLGRFLALRNERNAMSKFQEQAENLADELRRAYISEGMTHNLAEKTTIEKTVEMCRLSARTNLVKSILASSEFKEPKEVVAKLITETNTENNEVQILYYTRNNNNGRGRYNNFRGTNWQNRQNTNWQNRPNGQYRNNNNYRGNSQRGNNNNRNNNNYRGRGKQNYSQNNNYQNQQNRNNGNRNNTQF